LESCFGGGLGAPEGGGVLELLGSGGGWGGRQVCFVALFEKSWFEWWENWNGIGVVVFGGIVLC
jgi:hypothetical protein